MRFACEEAEKRGIELGLHNCPGYTSTGGPWIPPRLAMRELVFNVTNADCKFAKAVYPGGWYLEEIPAWFKDGVSARPSKGRKSFTDWNYFTKDSRLSPSGLMGPVKILPVQPSNQSTSI